jgi:polyferredoxin
MTSIIEILFSIFWGLLVGFVGWGACFRLPEPVSGWLLQSENPKDIIVGITRLLIVLFLIFLLLIALSWPIIIVCIVPFENTPQKGDVWRNLYGIGFVSSLIGFFISGFFQRFSR